jgi:gamma-glutamylcyclotransferase (GGCT)/AIG2-like uncharacterized protein YtfP
MAKIFAYGTLRQRYSRKYLQKLQVLQKLYLDIVYIQLEIEEEFGMNHPINNSTDESDKIEGIVYELTNKDLELADTY